MLASFVDKVALEVNGKLYPRQLETAGLTNARNALLELLLDNPIKKSALPKMVDDGLKAAGIEISSDDIQAAIKRICLT